MYTITIIIIIIIIIITMQRIISLLYRQFYSGSSTPTSAQEQAIVKAFLTSQNYVRAGQ